MGGKVGRQWLDGRNAPVRLSAQNLVWGVYMNETYLGYINMAVGIAGIVVTCLSAPNILAIGRKLPEDPLSDALGPFGSGVRSFSIILVLCTFAFLLALGVVMTLVPLAKSLQAIRPVSTCIFLVATLFSCAITMTLHVHQSPLWVPAIIGTMGLGSLAYDSAAIHDSGIGGLFGLFLVLFLISGVGALIAISSKGET